MGFVKSRPLLIGALGALLLVALIVAGFLLARGPIGTNEPLSMTGAVKIMIDQDGLYRITSPALRKSGLQFDDLNPGILRLSQAGQTVPYLIDDGAILFYGQAPTSRYTKTRAYIMTVGQLGNLMEELESPDFSGRSAEQIVKRLHLEENLLYDGRAAADGESSLDVREPWYWKTIQAGAQERIQFTLPEVDPGSGELELRLWGATQNYQVENDHDLTIMVNDLPAGIVRWDGETHFTGQMSLPNGLLKSGNNTLLLDNSVDGATPIDIMRLDWLELKYTAQAMASDGRLRFSGADGQLELQGFTRQPLIIELSDPSAPSLLTGWQFENNLARIQATADMELLAIEPSGYLSPMDIEPIHNSDLLDVTNQADMLIITTEELVPALKPLVKARESQGISVRLVPVDEIYDVFGHGQAGPESLVEFVRYAHIEWSKPRPRYLFLVGEATYDYRNYLEQGPINIVPAPMVPVSYSGETVSDARLADVDLDMQPDMAVGRWPVDDPRDVASLVERTLAYENGVAVANAIFAADGSSQEFTDLNDALLADSHFDAGSVERLEGATADEFIDAWNRGAWLVTYAGHGSLDRWGKEGLFEGQSVDKLQSHGTPPIVIQLTCLTGYFAHPTVTSLSEQMLLDENGPVLLVAATSLTLSSSQQPFGTSLLQLLQDPEIIRVGDALQQAKLLLATDEDSSLQEISDTFGLLGDPSALIIRPTSPER